MIYGILEIEIMNSIWNIHEQNEDANISVGDIVERLNNGGVERAYTTIKTVMDRLVAKDILVRYRDGKKFFYKSAVDRQEATRETIKEVSKQFFGGSYVEMLRFVEQECKNTLVNG